MSASLPAPGDASVHEAAVQDTMNALIAGCETQSAQPPTRTPTPRPCKQRKADSAPNITVSQANPRKTENGETAAAVTSAIARTDDSLETALAASWPGAAAMHAKSAPAAPLVSAHDADKTDVSLLHFNLPSCPQWLVAYCSIADDALHASM